MEEKKAEDYFARPPEMSRGQSMKLFLWNPKSSEFLGRTAKSWFQIIVFYIILYAFLAGFFAALLMVFYQTLDAEQPRWQLDSSRIGDSPGMGYRPQNKAPDTLTIEFNGFEQNDNKSYVDYIESLDKYLAVYNKSGDMYMECNYNVDVPEDKICHFPLSTKLPSYCNGNDYGFKYGKPCIFLKLNKVYGWKPQPYTTEEIVKNDMEMDTDLRNRILAIKDVNVRENNVWVSCEGEGDKDNATMLNSTITFGDSFGFPSYFYPFKNKEGYQAPFVVMQLSELPKNTLLRMICRLWAKNIKQDRQRRLGMTIIEVKSNY